MNRARHHDELRDEILARMASSRAALIVANASPPRRGPPSTPLKHPLMDAASALANAPRVTLLLVLCVGTIALGPRRALTVAGRSGITALLAGTARRAIIQVM
nr:hypothetical protein HUO10_005369 [Paraburkholderia busanensis]